MPTSYNGWPASKDPKAIGINMAWAPLGVPFPGGCKRGDVETVFTWLVEQLDARVEPIDLPGPSDEWGYFYKQSANSPSLLSCHASGTAFDYNATRHPNGKRGTWTKAQVAEIRRILVELDGVVRWLGDATGTPDEMHFEIHGTPAQVAAVAARLTAPAPTPAPAPPPTPTQEADVALYVLEPNETVTVPVRAGQEVALATDPYGAVKPDPQAGGVTARVAIGPKWHAPAFANPGDLVGSTPVTWVPPGKRLVIPTTVADEVVVVSHLARQDQRLTVTVG